MIKVQYDSCAAAVSQVEVHTALIVNELGLVEYRESFDRRTE